MAGINIKSINKSEVKDFLKGIDTILCDCDGVLCIIDDVVSGVPDAVECLKKSGKDFFYVTNNPTMTREDFSKTMNTLGYKAEPADVLSSAYLVAKYLKSIKFDKKVYVVGCDGISKELDSVGIKSTGAGPDILTPDLKTVYSTFKPDEEIGAVVVSFDEYFSYLKLMKAATYLNDPKVLFIATSMDVQIPVGKRSIPGPGTLVRCIETCSGRAATVLGKPESYVREVITDIFNAVPERTLVIGDSAHTDILMGKRCGFKTLLVLTGLSKEEDIENWKKSSEDSYAKELIPDFYTESLADLKSYL